MVKKTVIILSLLLPVCGTAQTTDKVGTGDCNGESCDYSDIATAEAAITETGAYTMDLYADGTFTISSTITIDDADPSSFQIKGASGEGWDGTSGSGVFITASAIFDIFSFARDMTFDFEL